MRKEDSSHIEHFRPLGPSRAVLSPQLLWGGRSRCSPPFRSGFIRLLLLVPRRLTFIGGCATVRVPRDRCLCFCKPRLKCSDNCLLRLNVKLKNHLHWPQQQMFKNYTFSSSYLTVVHSFWCFLFCTNVRAPKGMLVFSCQEPWHWCQTAWV